MTTIEAMMTKCPECEGAGSRTHDHPNDPWAKTWECRECEGAGEVVASCECCQQDAVEVFDGSVLCSVCAEEQRFDYAIEAVEYRS